MREKDLYRIIGNLKPDRGLKERIGDAVESKDKVRVEKRPVFIPVVMMLLICVNLGAMAVFFGGDRLNSHWAETSELSDTKYAEDYPTMQQRIDDFWEETQNYSYDFFTYTAKPSIDPYEGEKPWYAIAKSVDWFNNDEVHNMGGASVYRRYVQRVLPAVSGDYEHNIHTLHEYLVRYDGDGFEKSNILYVEESSYDETKGDFFEGKTLDTTFYLLDDAYGNGEHFDFMIFENENNYDCLRIYKTDLDDIYYTGLDNTYCIGNSTVETDLPYFGIPENGEIVMPYIDGAKYRDVYPILRKYGLDVTYVYPDEYAYKKNKNYGVDWVVLGTSFQYSYAVAPADNKFYVYLYDPSNLQQDEDQYEVLMSKLYEEQQQAKEQSTTAQSMFEQD